MPPSAVPKSAIANGVLLAVPATSRAESTLDSAACTKGWQRAITSKQPLVAAVYVPLPRPPHGTCLPEASTVASPRRKYVVATPAGRGDASTAIANLRALRTELEAVQELKNARAQALAALESGEFSRSRTLHAHAQAHAHVPAVAAAAAQPAL